MIEHCKNDKIITKLGKRQHKKPYLWIIIALPIYITKHYCQVLVGREVWIASEHLNRVHEQYLSDIEDRNLKARKKTEESVELLRGLMNTGDQEIQDIR